jgi:tetratricopeptide (TPR) repeat protein
MEKRRFSPKIFFAEMKRRRVTRVITIYTVVGLGIIELSDIIGGRFLIPEWMVQLVIILVIAGFPISIVLGWIYDIDSGGIQKTKPLTTREQRALPPISWRPSWLTLILLLVVIALTVTYCTVPRPNILGFKKTDWILISDLENNTAENIFDKSLVHALKVSIDQSKYVNVLPQTQVSAVLERMRKGSVEEISVPIALEIAQREHVKAVLSMAISEIGSTYLISAQLIDAATGNTVRSRSITVHGIEDILHSMNRLCTKVRKDLGEALNEIHFQTVSLPKATTSSLDALKSLTDGINAWTVDGNHGEAERLFLEAIELDPEFALAHTMLGSLYYWLNNRDKGELHFKQALAHSERLTEKERLTIRARIERFRGKYEEAILQYNLFLRKYPQASDAWFSLGYCYMRLDRQEEAIEAFNRSMAIHQEKDPNALINIASCYSMIQKYWKSIDFYREAFDLNPNLLTVSNLNHEYGFTYVKAGETEEARNVFEEMLNCTSEGRRAMGIRSMALLSMFQGKFTEAEELLTESIEMLERQEGSSRSSLLRDHLYLATVYQTTGKREEFFRELKNSSKIIQDPGLEPWWFMMLGKFYLRSGAIEQGVLLVEEGTSRINEGNRYDQAAMYILQGELEVAKGNAAKARDLLTKAINERRNGYMLESLAHCCLLTGDSLRASELYREIIDMRSLGWEAQPYWIEAHFRLAQLYEQQGDPEEAMKYYDSFLKLWEYGDPDIPDLTDARAKLTALQSSRSTSQF